MEEKEDPSIYGPRFNAFRQTLRQFNGIIPCRICGSISRLNLADIECGIRKNIVKQKTLAPGGTALVILPDWKYGAVCPKCAAYFCNQCVQKALQHKSESTDQFLQVLLRHFPSGSSRELIKNNLSSTQHTVLCPRCRNELLLGIDHITD